LYFNSGNSGYRGQGEQYDNICDYFLNDRLRHKDVFKKSQIETKPILRNLKTQRSLKNPRRNAAWKGKR
jgi:hypothetical protein